MCLSESVRLNSYENLCLELKPIKIFNIILMLLLLGKLSHNAPLPAKQDKWRWNPYYYPTARSLSIPPPPRTTTTTTTTLKPTTPYRPVLVRQTTTISTSSAADRRTFQSINSTNIKASIEMAGKNETNFNLGNVTAISSALNEFIRAAEILVRELLISTNAGLLKVLGQFDQGVEKFQRRLQRSGLQFAFAGQKAAAQTYEALPPFVNKLIQRLTTSPEGRSRDQLIAQLTDAVNNLRQLKKMLADALDDHEKDFHNVFQDRFTQVNQYLGVPELPRRPLAWYP